MIVKLDTGKICVQCGQPAILTIPEEEALLIMAWGENPGSGFVQDELPFLNTDQREMLITGTHPQCWAELFPDE